MANSKIVTSPDSFHACGFIGNGWRRLNELRPSLDALTITRRESKVGSKLLITSCYSMLVLRTSCLMKPRNSADLVNLYIFHFQQAKDVIELS